MSKDTNPASPGAPTQVVAETPVRNPIAGIPFSNYGAHPAAVGGSRTTPLNHPKAAALRNRHML